MTVFPTVMTMFINLDYTVARTVYVVCCLPQQRRRGLRPAERDPGARHPRVHSMSKLSY